MSRHDPNLLFILDDLTNLLDAIEEESHPFGGSPNLDDCPNEDPYDDDNASRLDE